jgi:hypothetical protein
MSFIALLGDGVRRVARAPMVLVGATMLTVAVALPPGLLLKDGLQAALRENPAGGGPAAACVPLHWWRFSHAVYPVDGRPCAAAVPGEDAFVDLRALLDAEGPDPALAAVVVSYLLAWTLFSAGAIDRYARNRPTRGAGFFAACGVYGPRLLRLALIAGVVYWILFRAVHPWAVGASPPPGGSPAVVVLRHLGFGLLLALVGLVFDYARVRAVVEDRRSMLGALLAGWRFVRRRPAACLGLYAANGLVLAGVVGAYAAVAPGVSTGTSIGWAFLVGQVYVVARLAARLLFYATEVSYFQSRLAHAGYVAAPTPAWPESASAEALGRLSG